MNVIVVTTLYTAVQKGCSLLMSSMATKRADAANRYAPSRKILTPFGNCEKRKAPALRTFSSKRTLFAFANSRAAFVNVLLVTTIARSQL